MVIPFSNTKLRVPKGFQSLLVGLSTEILRSQPKNINAFAADYFEKLLKRRDQGQTLPSEKQATLEDRYYNNPSFQEEYSVNDPEVKQAATKIQAKFRGHQARKNVEKMKQDNPLTTDTDTQELGYGARSVTPKETERRTPLDNKPSPLASARSPPPENTSNEIPPEEELTEDELREQERAAVSIQAKFRGYKARKNIDKERQPEQNQSFTSPVHQHSHLQDTEQSSHEDNATPTAIGGMGSSRHGKNEFDDDSDRPRLEREPTQLSEDFEKHTQVPHDRAFEQEQRSEDDDDYNDMNDSSLDKAATRIQASYRGYKIRKELGGNSQDQQQHPSSPSPQPKDEFDSARSKNILSPSAEGNKGPAVEEDDNAAAVKIQAAYRGYRVRKDLEK